MLAAAQTRRKNLYDLLSMLLLLLGLFVVSHGQSYNPFVNLFIFNNITGGDLSGQAYEFEFTSNALTYQSISGVDPPEAADGLYKTQQVDEFSWPLTWIQDDGTVVTIVWNFNSLTFVGGGVNAESITSKVAFFFYGVFQNDTKYTLHGTDAILSKVLKKSPNSKILDPFNGHTYQANYTSGTLRSISWDLVFKDGQLSWLATVGPSEFGSAVYQAIQLSSTVWYVGGLDVTSGNFLSLVFDVGAGRVFGSSSLNKQEWPRDNNIFAGHYLQTS